ncbi:MAG: helix-turn-helix domain-containing protein [Syntrophales bacterium]|nr:helix-turn-helix domain-containing protein [Syntrophales bacterium]
MQLSNTTEEKIMYEGFRILVRTITRAVLEELREGMIHRQDSGPISTQHAHDAPMVGKEERLVLSVTEAAKLLGLSRATAYQVVKSGQIPSIKIGYRILIPRAALAKFINESSQQG